MAQTETPVSNRAALPLRLAKLVLPFVFIYHALAISVTLIPAESKLSQVCFTPFQKYLQATGNQQTWNMFTSAPWYHDYEATVEALDENGEKHTFGAKLPGLEVDRRTFRYHSLLSIYSTPEYTLYLQPYLVAIGKELKQKEELKLTSYGLRMTSHALRPLDAIEGVTAVEGIEGVRQTGEMSHPRTLFHFGPHPLKRKP